MWWAGRLKRKASLREGALAEMGWRKPSHSEGCFPLRPCSRLVSSPSLSRELVQGQCLGRVPTFGSSAGTISRGHRPSPWRFANMPGKTYCCEVIGGTIPKGARARARGRSPSPRKISSLTTSTAWDTSTDETLPLLGEPLVDSQQSTGTLYGTESSLDTCCIPVLTPLCFLLQPPPPPPKLPCVPYRPPKVQGQEPWKELQIPEPGVPGPAGYPEYQAPPERLPRGQCLIHNWVEERATNELDRVLGHEVNEGFCYRHGHLGLLTLELCSPQASRTTHKDSYQDPGTPRKALRGRREAMLEMFLHDQIWKEVNQESSPPECFDYESVTHHDYKREQHRPRPPPPTQPQGLQEQPDPYCNQETKDYALSPICGLDVTPFGRNCSFLTSVPLCMDQPLPCNPEDYP